MNLIFDFDGTICDSFDLTIKIANDFLTKLNKPRVDAVRFRTNGIEEFIKDYKLNKLQILLYIIKGRRELSRHIDELKVFPGLTEVLQKLSQENKLGIVSSNSKKNIERLLENNNLASYFDFIYSSLTLFEKSKKIDAAIRKYDLQKNECIYIGDEVRDIEAAKKAGVKSIAVSWGFAAKKLLLKHQPDILITSPLELISVERQLQRL